MDSCLSFSDLDALLEDRLAPGERGCVESHLAACSKCSADFAALQRDASFLGDVGEILHDVVEQETVTGERDAPATAGERMPRIEGYVVKQLIGRGGMAAVYEAEQLKLKRTVALKLLSAVAGTAQPSLVTRFKREATAAAKLHHTNIIPIYDFGESPDGYYYAMEMIHGPTLRDMIRRLAAASAPDIEWTTPGTAGVPLRPCGAHLSIHA